MIKKGRKRKGNSVIGNKLDHLNVFSGNHDYVLISSYFGVAVGTFYTYLSGESAPSLAKVQEFILRYAGDHDKKMIDLNWLINDHDRRPGPVFIDENPIGYPRTEAEDISPAQLERPEVNAMRLRDYDKSEGKALSFQVVGEAAAFEGGGAIAGAFGEDDRSIWGEIEIPDTTHFVKIHGDSMSPVLLDGQYAMVGPEYLRNAMPEERSIVVVDVIANDPEQAGSDAEWEGVYCKRIIDAESTWLFESINPTFQPFSIHKNDCRLWPVIGVYFAGKGKPPKED